MLKSCNVLKKCKCLIILDTSKKSTLQRFNLQTLQRPSSIISKPRVQGHAAIHKYGGTGNVVGIV
jgi:hypothetical protein